MEIRKSLEVNFLTCKNCHQTYRKPKVLVCLHSFCQACLEEIVAKQDAENEAKERESARRYYALSSGTTDYKSKYHGKWSSKFRYGQYDVTRYSYLNSKPKSVVCPLCQKETVIPTGGVGNLPTDQLADRLASMVDRMPTYPVCDVCTKQPLLSEPVDNSVSHEQTTLRPKNQGQSQYIPPARYIKDESSSSGDEEEQESGLGSTLIGSDRSEHIPRSRHLTSESDRKQSRRRTTESVSSKANDPRPATATCLDCAKRLCTSCCDTHSKMPVTANHVLIRIDQMQELQCHRHPRELRRFYCLTCRTYVCIVCTFDTSMNDVDGQDDDSGNSTGHADHDILSIREAVAAYQDQLSRRSTTTQMHINEIESLLSSLQVCEAEMKSLYKAIDANAKECIEKIQRHQLYLRDRVDKLAGIPLKTLSNECNRLIHVTNDWYEFLNDEQITSRLDLMDPLEALNQGGPMLDRVEQCLNAASEPLDANLTQKPFLLQLKAAEGNTLNGDSGLVSSQSLTPPSNTDSSESNEDSRATYWRSRLGQFQPNKLEMGRIVSARELESEAKAFAAKWINTSVQTGPELIKALPPPKGAQRHRAIQVNFLDGNMEDSFAQTEPVIIGSTKSTKIDKGTQYISADINPPVSMYRSIKQMLVQK
ncbi:unnamed protein product [Calicophoron daubneyi]|uniref:B box-type domain-containing protein n=1 Tax=Calicophoron daubneyi TaxID=300641 RepID=A0AAV2TE62_CALDB